MQHSFCLENNAILFVMPLKYFIHKAEEMHNNQANCSEVF